MGRTRFLRNCRQGGSRLKVLHKIGAAMLKGSLAVISIVVTPITYLGYLSQDKKALEDVKKDDKQ